MRCIRSVAMTCVVAVVVYLQPTIAAAQQQFTPPAQFNIKWHAGISLREGSPAALEALHDAERLVGISVTYVRTLYDGTEVLRPTQPLTRQRVTDFLTAMRGAPAEFVEEDLYITAAATNPGDPRMEFQNALWAIKAPHAWDTSVGTGAVVAVLDTGILPHADLDPNVLPGYDFISDATLSNDTDGRDPNSRDEWDPNSGTPACGPQRWHGTQVAGTIAAVGANGRGIAGVAWDARVLPLRVLGHCAGGYVSDISDAIAYAAGGSVPGVPQNLSPAQVINLSMSTIAPCLSTLQNAVSFAHERGSVVVAAAGNVDTSVSQPIWDAARYTPGNCPNVISVAGLSDRGAVFETSSRGPTVTLGAPASSMSTWNTGTNDQPGADSYQRYAGTSAAAAHVAGAAALLVAYDRTLTPDQIKSRLRDTAHLYNPAQHCAGGCGSGILNTAAAIAGIRQVDAVPGQPLDIRVRPERPRPSTHRSYIVSWDPGLNAETYDFITRRVLQDGSAIEETRVITEGRVSEPVVPSGPGLYQHEIRSRNGSQVSPTSFKDVPYTDETASAQSTSAAESIERQRR